MSHMRSFISRNVQRRSRMRGLSLVELMIAMTISLIVLAAVGWIYQGTMKTYRTQDALARMQEGARYAFEVMGKDLRMAGATGCSFQKSVNVVTDYDDADKNLNLFELPISSVDKDSHAAGTVIEHSDALRVVHADVSREYQVQLHNSGAHTFTVDPADTVDFAADTFLVATDCDHAAVFAATAVAGNAVSHGQGDLNSTGELGETGAYTFLPGARLYRLSASTYYVKLNDAGVSSLYRLTPYGTEELVEGVDDLQVSFAVDRSSPSDGNADFYAPDPAHDSVPYLTGTWINGDAVLGANEQARWTHVVSVRISLLMSSAEDHVLPAPQSVTYDGAALAPGDTRLRKVFTHVVKLRNR
jgi:type IV pilus assembly protein PilW